MLWSDASPDPGEETALTATSPAFPRPVRLNRDDSKAADGADPRYYATDRIRPDLAPGSYPATVVSHHRRVQKSGRVLVTGERRAARASCCGGAAWHGRPEPSEGGPATVPALPRACRSVRRC
ncbi:hypothetical protein [Streptomyces sp. NPDC017529]|uniref:hypothetical protein n=1 Tax=Streptomyces sp. NPDC017529 TaxID=3365000 RepID=UPI0037BC3F09